MKFYIQSIFLELQTKQLISSAEFEEIKKSNRILKAAFSFEENYDLLICNYLAIEKAAHSILVTVHLKKYSEYHEWFELKSEINRHFVNFLSTARLYLDQLEQRVVQCDGDKTRTKEFKSREYDECFEYRFMEALRNHVQHNGLAVHGLEFPQTRSNDSSLPNTKLAIEVFSLKQFLSLDKKFKNKVLAEFDDKIELLSATRKYLESICKIHELVRNDLKERIDYSRGRIEYFISYYQNFTNSQHNKLRAFRLDPKEDEMIFLDWDNVRIKLSQLNKNLNKFSQTHFSY